MRPAQLTEKYRPATLADLYGQGAIACDLEAFAASPYPCALIFAGDTGVGKSSAARALANDLDAEYLEVKSGTLDGAMMEGVEIVFRYAPLSGWRVIVFSEADMMTPKAERLFLSLLEEIPARTVVVFTTNRPEWFDARPRLRDRCEVYRFAADAAALRQDAEALAARIWAAEGGQGPPPTLDAIPEAIEGDTLSFRRVVSGVQRLLRREAAFRLEARKPPQPSIFDLCGPFGRKPSRDREPAPDPTTAPPAAPPGHGDPIPLDDGDIIDVEPLPDDWEPEPPAVVAWSEPAPVAARRWVWELPPESPRPSVASVAKRWGISWDTARRVVTERWGFAEASA